MSKDDVIQMQGEVVDISREVGKWPCRPRAYFWQNENALHTHSPGGQGNC